MYVVQKYCRITPLLAQLLESSNVEVAMAALVTLADVNGADSLVNYLEISKKIITTFVEHVTALQKLFKTNEIWLKGGR